MISFLVRLAITAVAIWAADSWMSTISVDSAGHGTEGNILIFLGIALVFTVVNTLIKPILTVLSLPLLILSLGLFYLVVNALMLMLTAWVTQQLGWGLHVDGFWTAIGGSIIISIVSLLLNMVIPTRALERR